MTEIWGSLFIFLVCPIIGGLPLIDWINYLVTGRKLSQLGTGNIGVTAAFYHGGKLVGILAVISEAAKGIIVIFLTRFFFPTGSTWELLALIALVVGRYWLGKGAGTTNVFWGLIVHDFVAVFLTSIISGISFTIFREKSTGRLVGLFLLALILTLRRPHDSGYIITAIALACLLGAIFQKIADDLDLPEASVNNESKTMFRFFRGDRSIQTLDDNLTALKVGQKAATLAYLKRAGYPIPRGWILPPGDDPQPLIESLHPDINHPLVVRSSAIGEDSETASSAGQYTTILNVIDQENLAAAILSCQTSYNSPNAVNYRLDRGQENTAMAVLIQEQIRGVFSGVAFSRDPINPLSLDVVIEALPGDATRVVSGRITPESYRVNLEENIIIGAGDIPPAIIQQVANLCRQLETLDHGIPQDIEWTHDGQKLWLLQCRPITNLQPIWTRKIAAEVIPGVIRPLPWSINRPLTCGVWGDIFRLVLDKKALDLDFNETATLHYQRAYFNASLLGTIFRRMGLPPESLEFLTKGAKFTKPPLTATLANSPGLLKLLGRELQLEKDFSQDQKNYFIPTLEKINATSLEALSSGEILEQIEEILTVLKKATYYSILAPLSFALRRSISRVPFEKLDNSQAPEIASMRSLFELRKNTLDRDFDSAFSLWLETYGYLSEVGTDISIPRWRENPQELLQLPLDSPGNNSHKKVKSSHTVQKRLNIKNQGTEIYSRLLAHLRWHFLALETLWLQQQILSETGDIFYLNYSEVTQLGQNNKIANLNQIICQRRQQFQENSQLTDIPYIVYGQPPKREFLVSNLTAKKRLQGIAASGGTVEGRVKIMPTLQNLEIAPNTILVIPYTDSGWSPLLSRAVGIIAEVGGQLSHGAIIAREYGIPAVMDVHHAMKLLKDGQLIRLDGSQGIIEIL
ncbi:MULTISPECIES: glycerol-3-phosphate acyltransferase [Microcystis]|jgi:pyruvate,water dikinase|uniref:Glycerol-3-phosphate acyltransferase n=2 Tax=Microcystis TaxID=1125 RepID=A0ABU3HJJ5_9CHRO|nr:MULTISPECIES: glycerol-3-phosphate acyltransferase [Microcystis]MBD2117663.1 glycerol-3-phosphate acyltransferase [Microcystis wesenbergii FACHB-1339]MDT3674706.1 glycerol-3-phosphate acyltransferase [Microcystis wesenbergii NRERC-220]GAL92913.1 similar to phosphoenolpyruvate synthase [Microcystis aeruginosa NIES-44]